LGTAAWGHGFLVAASVYHGVPHASISASCHNLSAAGSTIAAFGQTIFPYGRSMLTGELNRIQPRRLKRFGLSRRTRDCARCSGSRMRVRRSCPSTAALVEGIAADLDG
ncbi:MAG: hypothetical protein ABR524_14635, partial [Thermoanaerobaculia bacterium]